MHRAIFGVKSIENFVFNARKSLTSSIKIITLQTGSLIKQLKGRKMYKYLLSLMMLSAGSALLGADDECMSGMQWTTGTIEDLLRESSNLRNNDYTVIRDKKDHTKFVYRGKYIHDGIVIVPYNDLSDPSISYRAAVIAHYDEDEEDTKEVDINGKPIYEVSNLCYEYLDTHGPGRNMYTDFNKALKKLAMIAAIYGDVDIAKERLAAQKIT